MSLEEIADKAIGALREATDEVLRLRQLGDALADAAEKSAFTCDVYDVDRWTLGIVEASARKRIGPPALREALASWREARS